MSAFLSGSETAIISVSPANIHKLKKDGNKRAVTLSKLLKDKEGFIGAILLCNNLTNSAASAIATDLCIEVFGDGGMALFIATIVMAGSILIMSEMIPKTYAVRYSEKMSLRIAFPCYLITLVFSPIVKVINMLVDRVIRLFEGPNSNLHVNALDTIRSTIDIHHQEGEVVSEYKYMLGGVIDLETMNVEEVMIHRNEMFSINLDQPVRRILQMIAGSPYSRIPLWRGTQDNIVAVLHVKDMNKILLEKTAGHGKLTIKDIEKHTRAPWFIPNTTNLKTQLVAFKEQHYHIALVVDEYGEMLGMITLEDIIEEVVGQIEDEYDISQKGVFKTNNDGSVVVSGNTPIRDINRELEWAIDQKEATTIGGLLFHIAQRVPEIGEKFAIDGHVLKLIKKNGNKILKVKISKVEKSK